MALGTLLQRVYKKIERIDLGWEKPAIQEQMAYLSTFRQPKDDVDMSYRQFLCQKRLMSPTRRVISVIGSFFVYPFFLIYLRLISHKINFIRRADAVFLENGMNMDIIPDEVKQKYPYIIQESMNGAVCLTNKEITLLWKVFCRHPFSPFFNLKVCMKLALYCAHIRMYQPKSIISYCETSYSSAIVTGYLESMGIQHINVMHGIFLKSIRFAGFRFSAFYIWGEHYEHMFRELGNDSTPYIISRPDSLTKACNNAPGRCPDHYLTYYLGAETPETLLIIREILDRFTANKKKCVIRAHPRESDMSVIKRIFHGYEIEDPRKISLSESLDSAEYVCALNSTVLMQAWVCGKNVVLNDISDPTGFNRLKDEEYILLDKDLIMLSSLDECASLNR